MWELKSKSVKRLSLEEVKEKGLPIGKRLMLELSVVLTDGSQDIELSTFIKSKNEVRQTIKQTLDSLNEQVELEQEIASNTFVLEVVPEEPTAEEIAKREEQQKEAELQEAIRKAKLYKEAEELSATDDGVRNKLDEIKAIRRN